MITLEDIFDTINRSIDDAIKRDVYELNLFEYLQANKTKKNLMQVLSNSFLLESISHQIEELDLYLNEGDRFDIIKESYEWMGKLRAQRMKNFLEQILSDVKEYEKPRRRGRKPKSSNK
jgi:hypothetical protein